MHVVTGVSGNTGRAVASALLNKGQRIRVVVRQVEKGAPWAAKGAEVAVASFEDTRGLSMAIRDAASVYVLMPPNLQTHDQVGLYRDYATSFREALSDQGIPHAVVLSSIGAERDRPFAQLHEMERILSAAPMPITFLRASFFMENLLQALPMMRAEGALPSFLDPNGEVPMVACRDIGEAAANLMIQGANAPRVVEITGPKQYSYHDAAAAFSKALGTPVKAFGVPADQIVPSVMKGGASKETAEFFRDMYASIERGEIQPEGQDVPVWKGRTRLEDEAYRLVSANRSAYMG